MTGIHVIQSKVKKQGISPSWRIISSFALGQILGGPAARIQTAENVVNFLRLLFCYYSFQRCPIIILSLASSVYGNIVSQELSFGAQSSLIKSLLFFSFLFYNMDRTLFRGNKILRVNGQIPKRALNAIYI